MEDESHTNFPNGIITLKTCNSKEQDRFLPIANVGRIMKRVIPGNGKISKDAKETVQECVSEFISFVTGEASDKCQREKRKTINGDDIIWAITILGFENYVDPLKSYIHKYKEIEGDKLNIPKQQRQQHQQDHNNNNKNDDDNNNNLPLSSVYLISQPPYVATDQVFSLPFYPDSIHKQYSSKTKSIQWANGKRVINLWLSSFTHAAIRCYACI